jgi:hypothetical protein
MRVVKGRFVCDVVTTDCLSPTRPAGTGAMSTYAGIRATSTIDDEINDAICSIADTEISSGRECGLQIVAFLHGKQIVDVCAGSTANGEQVAPHTTFMAYSVAKGVSSTIIARSIDASKGRVRYTDPVSQHWPGFEQHGKEHVTIADALSHRAGLRARSLCPIGLFKLMCCGRFTDGMSLGIEWIASCSPSWPLTPRFARYHPTSWSWVAGGVYAHVTKLRRGSRSPLPHIREGAEQIAAALRVPNSHFAIGEVHSPGRMLPTPLVVPLRGIIAEARAKASRVVGEPKHVSRRRSPTWRTLHHCGTYCLHVVDACWRRVLCFLLFPLLVCLATLEAVVWTLIGNRAFFVKLCLPSSNGCFTARALGRLYGALANGGSLGDGTVVLSGALIEELKEGCMDPSKDARGWPTPGRLTCGFSPWLGEQLEDGGGGVRGASGGGSGATTTATRRRLSILGHPGMGGCCAYADLGCGLSVAVLKNAFSPESLNGGGPGRTCRLVDACLREKLGLAHNPTGAATTSGACSGERRELSPRPPAGRKPRASRSRSPARALLELEGALELSAIAEFQQSQAHGFRVG